MAILFFAVIIVAAAVVFSYQNSLVVTLSFVTWQFTASLAIVVFLAVLAGMLIMGFVWTFTSFKRRMKRGAASRELKASQRTSVETAKSP